MRLEIETIEARSVKADLVIELSRRHQGSLGMMPFDGFHSAAERGFIVGAFDGETLAGYVMFRVRNDLQL